MYANSNYSNYDLESNKLLPRNICRYNLGKKKEMIKIKIDNWHFSKYLETRNVYHAPEEGLAVICGLIYGHQDIKEGSKASILLDRIVERNGPILISISRNEYELGDPNPEYEKMFPDCRNRILKNINDVENESNTIK